MRRLSHEDLRLSIEISLKCMRGPERRAGGWDSERAVKDAADRVMADLAGTVILAPDLIVAGDWGTRAGKFGETEPWPFEPGHKPPE